MIDGPTPSQMVAEITPHRQALIAFSGGKDAWGAYIAAREHLDLHPYHLYLIPGLEFEEEYLSYCERTLGKRIIRLPHPSLYRMLNNLVFQPPERCAIIEAAQLPNFDYADIVAEAIKIAGVPQDAFTASGIRAADSPMRRMVLSKNKGISLGNRHFYPVWDWKKDRLIEALKANDIRLSCDYLMFSRSFDGIDLRFLYQIKQHHPRDYQRILEWFPLADLEIFRYEQAKKAA